MKPTGSSVRRASTVARALSPSLQGRVKASSGLDYNSTHEDMEGTR